MESSDPQENNTSSNITAISNKNTSLREISAAVDSTLNDNKKDFISSPADSGNGSILSSSSFTDDVILSQIERQVLEIVSSEIIWEAIGLSLSSLSNPSQQRRISFASPVSMNRGLRTSSRLKLPENVSKLSKEESLSSSGLFSQSSSSTPVTPRQKKFSNPKETSTRKLAEDDVLVGIKISEGHVNYSLMYDMLTGIRISVSRCVSKPHQELTTNHFRARHKLTFDVMGNELTPSSRYDFKFKDYAPWVFRNIREHFKIEPAEYLISLTGKYVLSELGSPGKSGSFFYFSQDYRFIIKTIHSTEHKFLRKILPQYYEHVKTYPNTLLCRFYGLHRVKLPQGSKIHFVVMGNVFPPNKDIHEKYDLKGSLIGREAQTGSSVLKDVNWINTKKRLKLGDIKAKILKEQIENDVNLLMDLGIMDYSLLVGVHYLQRGNSENIRENSLSVFEPDISTMSRQPVSNSAGIKASNLRRVLAQSDPVQLDPNKLPEQTPLERKDCVFYSDDGGFLSTDTNDSPLNELYFIGIIDILTPYNIVKRTENMWKSLSADKDLISAVNPVKYGKRFITFMYYKVIGHSANENSTLDYIAKVKDSSSNKPKTKTSSETSEPNQISINIDEADMVEYQQKKMAEKSND